MYIAAARAPLSIASEIASLFSGILDALRRFGKWFFDNLEIAERYAPYWMYAHPNQPW